MKLTCLVETELELIMGATEQISVCVLIATLGQKDKNNIVIFIVHNTEIFVIIMV